MMFHVITKLEALEVLEPMAKVRLAPTFTLKHDAKFRLRD
jgi:hypothetical protein